MKKIKTGDEVVVRIGKDKGKSGRVTQVLKNNKILVEGINQVKKSQKPNPNDGTVEQKTAVSGAATADAKCSGAESLV